MKALKLVIAIAIAATASVSFADTACNGQAPVKMFDNTAVKRVAASKTVVPATKTKAVKGINDRG
ncbi:hypothetical protein [Bdellovibrio sp. HCB274]|uniref:hypothetical protein n=1 Tax=Bdellovibrio sp. HCB274 TaxID=3394361 RepID=UPI0039B400BF